MSNDNNRLPPEVVNYWPEIFQDIEIKAIPINYINSINIKLSDGSVWSVEIDQEKEEIEAEDLELLIEELLDDREDDIVGVDFSLDTAQIKEDIKKRTNLFMKKRR